MQQRKRRNENEKHMKLQAGTSGWLISLWLYTQQISISGQRLACSPFDHNVWYDFTRRPLLDVKPLSPVCIFAIKLSNENKKAKSNKKKKNITVSAI